MTTKHAKLGAVMNYSRGVFVNLFEPDPEAWLRQIERYDDVLPRDSHYELLMESVPNDAALRRLDQATFSRQITVHGPYVGVSLAHPDADLRSASVQRVIRSARAAAELGAKVLTVHAGPVGVWEDRSDSLSRLVDSLEEIAQVASPMPIAIENMPTRSGGTRELVVSCSDLIQLGTMSDAFSYAVDIGHCIQNGEDFSAMLSLHSERIANIHLHDGHAGGAAHLPLGSGELDLNRVIDLLSASQYNGHVALETLGFTDTIASWDEWQMAMDHKNKYVHLKVS